MKYGSGFWLGAATNVFALAFCLPLLAVKRGNAVPYVPMSCAFIVLATPAVLTGLVLSVIDIAKRRKAGWTGILFCLTCVPLYFDLSAWRMQVLQRNDD